MCKRGWVKRGGEKRCARGRDKGGGKRRKG